MSTPDLAFEALALVGVVRGPVGVEVMLLLRLPQPLRAPLVLGPCTHVCYLTVHMYTLYTHLWRAQVSPGLVVVARLTST